jgi:hypothetical protein
MMKNIKYGGGSSSEITETEMHSIDVSEHFDGQQHKNWRRGIHFQNPRDLEGGPKYSALHYNKDFLGRQTQRAKDLQRYIDPADGKPRRLIVQATRQVLEEGAGDWRRTKVRGHAPGMLRLSNWVLKTIFLKPEGHKSTAQEIAIVVGKVLVASPLLTFLVMLPVRSEVTHLPPYTSVPIVSWEYPRYARNDLDASPVAAKVTRTWRDQEGIEHQDVLDFSKQHARRLKPDYLVVRHEEGWRIEENVDDLPYVLISYFRYQFPSQSKEALYHRAAELTTEAGLKAYWIDICLPQDDGQSKTNGIHTICDHVRGARQVIVVVKDMSNNSLTEWGRRMWTLPEVLLSSNELIKFAPIKGPAEAWSRISLATKVWTYDQNARLLAEHFSKKLTLSRLELFSVALKALGSRKTDPHFSGDLAYCLMGLLGHRPSANPTDNLFQALARLSLANDSDQIVERLTCMLPKVPTDDNINKEFVLDDRYGSNLWDIEPLCQVAGVCEGRAVILDVSIPSLFIEMSRMAAASETCNSDLHPLKLQPQS